MTANRHNIRAQHVVRPVLRLCARFDRDTTIHDYISTPGEILLEEFLEPLGISQYRLAKAIGKPQSAVSDIVHGRRAISVEMARLLGKALGTTPEFWLNLEMTYQLKTLDESKLPQVTALPMRSLVGCVSLPDDFDVRSIKDERLARIEL